LLLLAMRAIVEFPAISGDCALGKLRKVCAIRGRLHSARAMALLVLFPASAGARLIPRILLDREHFLTIGRMRIFLFNHICSAGIHKNSEVFLDLSCLKIKLVVPVPGIEVSRILSPFVIKVATFGSNSDDIQCVWKSYLGHLAACLQEVESNRSVLLVRTFLPNWHKEKDVIRVPRQRRGYDS